MNKLVKAWHNLRAALRIFGEAQHRSLRTRLMLGLLITAIYLATVLVGMPQDAMLMNMPDFGDSAGYLHFSPYRQPMYGTWANAIHAFFGSWDTVQILQLGMFVAFSSWVIIELAIVSRLGLVAALLFVAMQVLFTRLKLLNLVVSLLSEGLFYPMIMLMVAMLLTWLRTRSAGVLAALALLLVCMTQLRAAALLVVAVPTFAALYVLVRQPMCSAASRSSVLVLCTVVIGLLFMPPLFGKAILQVRTIADSMGRDLLPRVSLLPPPRLVAERSPDWVTISRSWRAAAAQLDAAELTQFDAQLQETIRYGLAVQVLLPALLNRSSKEVEEEWAEGTVFDDAKQIAIDWIVDQWPTYIRLSSAHLWGMLTMANFMDNRDRERVGKALNDISEVTWHSSEAPYSLAYPLSQIYERLPWITNSVYLSIRYVSIGILILGAISAMTVLRQTLLNHKVPPGSLTVALAVGWAIAHSLPAAFVVFPEYRFTLANMLVMFSSGAVWLAYFGVPKTFALRPRGLDLGLAPYWH
jgi:hypothetical protein